MNAAHFEEVVLDRLDLFTANPTLDDAIEAVREYCREHNC